MRLALGFALLMIWGAAACAADTSANLTARQQDAKKQQAELRARIGSLQKEIDTREASRRDAADALKESESAISTISRHIADLSEQSRKIEGNLKEIEVQISRQEKQKASRQKELADQLRAQYASGLSPWTALLSGDDPQAIGRDLSYLGYISRAQAETVRAIRKAIEALAALEARAQSNRREIKDLAQESMEQKKGLEEQKNERQKILARIDAVLKQQHAQAENLEHNDQRLGKLIGGLEAAIAKQAQEARLAEERRKAEQARKAEAARKAEQARRLEIERRREAAREAALAAERAQEQAKRAQDTRAAEKARQQVEQARAQARAAEQAANEPDKAKLKPEPSKRVDSSVRVAPDGGFRGLQKNLPRPVRGEVQGRFGAQRPDGGLWRGIVLRSAEGTPVHAIAAGRVVYAHWLSGFGNIMIVDHGANYLSVYGYNQSLLKRVGDIVRAGDTIATVGASGGQVESGLYFEIRHQGNPVNPLLWLER